MNPIVLGAGPAGSMAAIALAKGGAEPILIDRDAAVGDALCGGFLSWRTAARLRALGIDPAALGAHRIKRLALFAGEKKAVADLPAPGFGVSRKALDSALRDRAVAAGARLKIDRARAVAPGLIEGERREWRSDAIFLATGKHDVRGLSRPRAAADPALGLRIRIPADANLRTLLSGTIELHLFAGGYAGIVLQEGGGANVCLALRKSLLAEAGGAPRALLDRLAEAHPAFARRMRAAPPDLQVDSLGSVPYGWIARATEPGVFRLGDQAAVIPSLAGEGMAIALASGEGAAKAWLGGRSAQRFQSGFARSARRPVAIADVVWRLAEGRGASPLVRGARAFPGLARIAMELTRVG